MSRQEIKELSKKQLGGGIFQGKWMMGVLIVLISEAISFAIASFLPIASIIVAGPIGFGMAYTFIKLSRTGEDIQVKDLFEGFKRDFGGTFLLGLMQSIFIMLWSLLFVIPGMVKSYSYSMAYYVKNDHPEYGWNECLKESMEIMNGHKADLFVQDLSFIGWILVGSLACGIGIFWVEPYAQLARANFYESIKKDVSVETEYSENVY